MTNPEQIVRALAAADPSWMDGGGVHWCALCDTRPSAGHRPDCPWRLAVEWVAAEDARAAWLEAVNEGERAALRRARSPVNAAATPTTRTVDPRCTCGWVDNMDLDPDCPWHGRDAADEDDE